MKLDIGIIARETKEPAPFGDQNALFEELIEMCDHLPVDVFMFSPMQWNNMQEEIQGYRLQDKAWVEVKKRIPELIYDRFIAHTPLQKQRYTEFIHYLTENGTKFASPVEFDQLLKNKVEFHAYLNQHHIPTLEAVLLRDLTETVFWRMLDISPTLYIKPVFGWKGQGIAIMEIQEGNGLFKKTDGTELVRLDDCFEYLKSAFETELYFVQPRANMIDYMGRAYDIRVQIQNYGRGNYQIVGKGLRVSQKGGWVSNLAAGGEVQPPEVLRPAVEAAGLDFDEQMIQVDNICRTCTLALHERFGDFAEIGYDVLLTVDRGPIILEGNSKPSKGIFSLLTDCFPAHSPEHQECKRIRQLCVSLPVVYMSELAQKND